MKRICIIVILVLIIFMVSCNIKDATGNQTGTETSQTNAEDKLIKIEQQYLNSNTNEDLKNLCWEIYMQIGFDIRVPQMILKYYPILFSEFTSDQMSDISNHGLDSFYSAYVISYLVEDMGELKPIYQEYKEKAEDAYYYANGIYMRLSLINNLSLSDQEFLYNEAIRLYEEAKKANSDFHTRFDAFGCVTNICEVMSKNIDPKILEEMGKLAKDYNESIN